MKKKKRKKHHPVMRAAQAVGMPAETDSTIAKATILGHNMALVENHRGVYACEENGIALTGAEGLMRIKGENLEIRELDRDSMLVVGYITGITYE